MSRKRWRGKYDATAHKRKEQYIPLSYAMVRSNAFRSLSGAALKVFLEIRTRFHGSNNGELSLSVKDAKQLLGLAQATIHRAFAELEVKGFLRLIRRGHWYGKKAALWLTTDRGVDGEPPTNAWRHWKATDDGTSTGTRKNISRTSSGTYTGADGTSSGTQNPHMFHQEYRQPTYPQGDGTSSGTPIYHSSTAPLLSAAKDTVRRPPSSASVTPDMLIGIIGATCQPSPSNLERLHRVILIGGGDRAVLCGAVASFNRGRISDQLQLGRFLAQLERRIAHHG
jgi:hypothetical protein